MDIVGTGPDYQIIREAKTSGSDLSTLPSGLRSLRKLKTQLVKPKSTHPVEYNSINRSI
jgi:hypothetical protein